MKRYDIILRCHACLSLFQDKGNHFFSSVKNPRVKKTSSTKRLPAFYELLPAHQGEVPFKQCSIPLMKHLHVLDHSLQLDTTGRIREGQGPWARHAGRGGGGRLAFSSGSGVTTSEFLSSNSCANDALSPVSFCRGLSQSSRGQCERHFESLGLL